MDGALFEKILRNISVGAAAVGILAGLDLLLGGRIILSLKRMLSKTIDFDKAITKITSVLIRGLDKKVLDIDKAVFNTLTRIVLGILFLILATLIILLSRI